MLNSMRKNLKKLSWVLWLVIAAFIGTIFAVWGVGGGGGQRGTDMVAWIDDKPVTTQEFYETRQRLRNWYQQIYGERFAEYEERLQLSDAALSQIIQVQALLKASQEFGITISEEQVKKAIVAMPEFQEDGRFSAQRLQRLLAINHIDQNEFIEQMKSDLARRKVQQLLTDAFWVSDPELKASYRLEKEMVRLEYLQINSRLFTEGISVTDSEVENYFAEQAEKYQIPDKVSVRFVTIDPEAIKADVNLKDQFIITQDDIEEYYYANDSKYSTEKEVRARHILFKADGSNPEQSAAARKKAEAILAELRNGADFIELAQKHSEDTSAAQGGDVGFFPQRGRMVEPFANAAFALEKGDISDIVQTKYGYHIIRVEEIKEAGIRELSDVEQEIKTALIDQKALQLAEKKAERIRERFATDMNIDAVSKRFDLEVKDTALFAQREIIPDLGWMPELTNAAFMLEPDEMSPLVLEKNKYYLLVLKEKVQAHQAQFQEVKDQVKNDLIEQLSVTKAQDKMQSLQAKIKAGNAWDTLTDGDLVKLGDTGLFSRKQSIKGIGKDNELVQTAFQGHIGDIIGPREIRQMVYLFRIVEKQDPDWAQFETDKEKFRQQQLSMLGNKYYSNWLEQQKSKLRVVKNQNFFERLSP